MKNKLFTLLFFVFFFSNSQVEHYSKGTINKDRLFLIDRSEISAIDENENFISIRPHRINGTLRNYNIEFYKNLNFDSRLEVRTQNQTQILEVFIKNGKVYVLIRETNKKSTSLRFDIINLSNKNVSKKELFNLDKNNNSSLFKSLKHDSNIYIDHSNNILIGIPFIENDDLATKIYSFNKNLDKQFEKTIVPKKGIKPKNISLLNIFQNQNQTFFLYNYKNENNEKHYQLVKLNNGDTDELTFKIEHELYEIVNSNTDENTLIICGLTSKKRKGDYNGFSYYKIDLNEFNLTIQNQVPFISEEILNYFQGLFKGKKEIDIQNIFIDNANNTYIVGQFYQRIKHTLPEGPYALFSVGATAVYITYNPIQFDSKEKEYDDILIAKIDNKGNLIWDKLLGLKKTGKIKSISYHRDSSYFTFFDNNGLNILMNGFINIEKEKLKVKQDKRKGKTNFYNIVVSPEGTILTNILLSNSDSEIIFKAKKSIFSNGNIYNLGQGNMRRQLIKINKN